MIKGAMGGGGGGRGGGLHSIDYVNRWKFLSKDSFSEDLLKIAL